MEIIRDVYELELPCFIHLEYMQENLFPLNLKISI